MRFSDFGVSAPENKKLLRKIHSPTRLSRFGTLWQDDTSNEQMYELRKNDLREAKVTSRY